MDGVKLLLANLQKSMDSEYVLYSE
jgi:hypothetical protein